jgi:hypothetical protein
MCAYEECWQITDVRFYYDINMTLLLNHYVMNINMINEGSSKCDISLNQISRVGGVEHFIMFCSLAFWF